MRIIMATKTATKRPVKVTSREEAAKAVTDTTTADATGRELAAFLIGDASNGETRIFNIARITFAGLDTGATKGEVAKALAEHVAKEADPARRDFMLAESVTKGGAKMSPVAIGQYADAYKTMKRGGMTPSALAVSVAFRAFTSAGAPGLAEAHTKLLAKVSSLPEAEREAYYVTEAPKVAGRVKAAKKAAHAEKAATKSADAKAEKDAVESESILPETVEEVATYLRAVAALKWSKAELAKLGTVIDEIGAEIAAKLA